MTFPTASLHYNSSRQNTSTCQNDNTRVHTGVITVRWCLRHSAVLSTRPGAQLG